MKDLRRDYGSRSFDEDTALGDPIAQFRMWFDDAVAAQLIDPNAMALATATRDGVPAVRTVLLKDVNESGFVFFTSYASPKARDLADNPVASLLFFWAALERQVRVSGSVSRVPRELSEEYFASRPTTSQWAAWASTQSAPLPDRAALEAQFEQIKRRFGEAPAPCPPEWGGYALAPQHIEFWQGRPSRLHDRLLYTKRADGTWSRTRLSP